MDLVRNGSKVHETFRSIARCPNVQPCLEARRTNHPCYDIVNHQVAVWGVTSYADFQLPEPWTGQIDRAPILFVGSNPSIGKDRHSVGSSSDEEVWDSHHNVFSGKLKQYTWKGKYTVDVGGIRSKRPVPTWAFVINRARELIPQRDVIPGVDFALTEVVHCKSLAQIGVRRAVTTCTELHFDEVLRVAAASVIVAMGDARGPIASRCGFKSTIQVGAASLGGRDRLAIFIGHPTGPEFRKFSDVCPDDLPRLRAAVSLALQTSGAAISTD